MEKHGPKETKEHTRKSAQKNRETFEPRGIRGKSSQRQKQRQKQQKKHDGHPTR